MKRLLALSALLLVLVLAATPGVTATPGQLQFQRLNRTYNEMAPDLMPVTQGPLTINLSSPRNQLTVSKHLIRIEPGPGGSHSADLEIEFLGKGWLIADVAAGPMQTRLQDEVVVPAQRATLQGRVRVRRVEGGYGITPEQLPDRIAVRIESGIGRQLVGVCDGASVLLALDCPTLERSLSRAVIPLPEVGEEYLLEDTEITAEERAQLDEVLRNRF